MEFRKMDLILLIDQVDLKSTSRLRLRKPVTIIVFTFNPTFLSFRLQWIDANEIWLILQYIIMCHR